LIAPDPGIRGVSPERPILLIKPEKRKIFAEGFHEFLKATGL
jgi:hypothetical protein